MDTTRTFTVDELEELDVTAGGDSVLSDEIHKEHRWYSTRRVVFRAEDGQLWQVDYREPATEMQEGIDTFASDPVRATQVEPYEVTVTKYRPVTASPTERTN